MRVSRLSRLVSTITVLLGVTACAQSDRVVFVTATEVAVSGDLTYGSANIGYDRTELVIAPAYPDTGAIPPVYAKVDSNLELFSPSVRQLYATGEAARLVTNEDRDPPDRDGVLEGDRRVMVFGTTSNIGLNLRWVGSSQVVGAPESIVLGYKRKEFSIIPLRSREQGDPDRGPDPGPDRYGSVIAGLSMGVETDVARDAGFEASQFIATGDAANFVAESDDARELFRQDAEGTLSRAAAAVKAVPENDADLQDRINPICRLEFRRGDDSELNTKLNAVETLFGSDIGPFCTRQDITQAEVDRLEGLISNAGISLTPDGG